jgi:hypothetical protein
MKTKYDLFQDEAHYGWVVDKRYDWINMLTKMKENKPHRFEEFKYSNATIYFHIDRLNQEQNLDD